MITVRSKSGPTKQLSFLRSRLIAVTRNPDHASRWHQRRARRRQRLPLDAVVLRARLPGLVAAVSAGDGRLRTVVRGLHALAVLHKTPTFWSFPYACPEPVLVKRSFLYIKGSKRAFVLPWWRWRSRWWRRSSRGGLPSPCRSSRRHRSRRSRSCRCPLEQSNLCCLSSSYARPEPVLAK
jgi:hypothetical protein